MQCVFKIITKVIALRLREFLGNIVSPNQASFVSGRHIQDNIVIAQELIHTMDRLKRNKRFIMIKVDLEKAYDTISWNFLEETLVLIGLPDKLRSIIMDCVSSVTMRVLWNDEPTNSFRMQRGIRQGCPLSPYLFVLCLERFSHCILDSVNSRRWNPIRVGVHGPPVSHLMFADDILLFAEASQEQMGEKFSFGKFL